ncbi:hypothetical protein ABW21_db0200099 [Orbilia brochopaga]|nr:hypothetical protein ABW21_db0200099 [Drechslerella brochopaga]
MEVASVTPIRGDDDIDHSGLSAIAAFNRAHDESQKASQQAVAASLAFQQPATEAESVTTSVLKSEPTQVRTISTISIIAPNPPTPSAPPPSAPVAPSLSANNTAAGVKRSAEALGASSSPSKRQHLSPSVTPTHAVEQPVAAQTPAVNGHRPQNGDTTSKDHAPDYSTDSEDDYEKHPPEDPPAGGSGYSFSSTFSNGQLLDPSQHLRIQSLPILDNLSSQLLSTLLQGQFQDTLNTATQPETDQGQAYATLKALFCQTKNLYSSEAFLSTEELKFQVPEHRNMIRQVNLATFITSLFGSTEVGFSHIHDCFLSTFVPEGGRLLKLQGGLFLSLKTQAYIGALDLGEKTKEQLLEVLFGSDVASTLTDRRGGSKELIPSEVEFLNRLKNRRDQLEKTAADVPALRDLYPWSDFLKEVVQYVAKHRDSILAPITRKKLKRLEAAQAESNKNMFSAHSQTPYGQHPYPNTSGLSQPVYPGYSSVGRPSMHATYNGTGTGVGQTSLSGSSPNPTLSTGTLQTPHPEQTTPTHILYEQARLAATARQSPNARRAGLPSQRRPWSTEEEHALMHGLDHVKGPHWSQILAMFGAGGTVNEALKDRNQVQLKDKARNLKLFFLKSGMEVPYYLQFVTGELKTRAPGQVAKNEKRKQQEEEANQNRATADALNVLTAGAAHGEAGHAPAPRVAQSNGQPIQHLRPAPVLDHPRRWAIAQDQPQPQPHPQTASPQLKASPAITASRLPAQTTHSTPAQSPQQTPQTRPSQPQSSPQIKQSPSISAASVPPQVQAPTDKA